MKTTVSKTYALKWQIKGNEHYKVSACGAVINMQRGKVLRRVLNNRCVGYWIAGKFYTIAALRNMLERINHLPF
jgi:hypothetical protein